MTKAITLRVKNIKNEEILIAITIIITITVIMTKRITTIKNSNDNDKNNN